MVYTHYRYRGDSGLPHKNICARYDESLLLDALYDAAFYASVDSKLLCVTVDMPGRRYVFPYYGGDYNRCNVCGDIAETWMDVVELVARCRCSCDVRDADGELVCCIGIGVWR